MLNELESMEGYRKYFIDPIFWTPFINKVFNSLGVKEDLAVRPGLAGTFPTFLVNDHWVIKFFGRQFDGQESFIVEKSITNMVHKFQVLPSAPILYDGELHADESPAWSFLITQFIPGVYIGSILDHMPYAEKKKLAGWLGSRLRQLHEIPVEKEIEAVLPKQHELLAVKPQDCIERQIKLGILPDHLINQIGSYLENTQNSACNFKPHIIHADLTSDHILGEFLQETWHTHAVIDYGDAMIGNLAYELIPIHLDIFSWDKGLLRAFITGYGQDAVNIDELPHAGLRMMLLHRFSVFDFLNKDKIKLEDFPSLDHLADHLWNIKTTANK